MRNLVNPPAPRLRMWSDSADALPIGVPRKFLPSSGQGLTIAAFPPDYEYRRAIANPHLYDERDLEQMHENYLIRYALTEWDCNTCGQWNLTPDADFSSATPCNFCCPIPTPEES